MENAPAERMQCLPAMGSEALRKVAALQGAIAELDQVMLPTEHLIHAGMYARTIRMAPGVVLAGAMLKVATVVIVNGPCTVFLGEEARELDGFNVLAGAAGRKQAFVSHGEVCITAIFPTSAQTVAEAEVEATDEYDALQTRTPQLQENKPCHMQP